jgi:fluoride exporter
MMSGPLLYRIGYLSIASALCGSITTFSSWQAETSKLILMQSDHSWGSVFSTYQGGRLWDFLFQQWSGFSVSYLALIGGHHASDFLSTWTCCVRCTTRVSVFFRLSHIVSMTVWFIIVFTGLATAIIVIVPSAEGWEVLTWSAILGGAGAYTRYILSFLNPKYPTFPIGTFIANVAGTWIFSAVNAMSRFYVSWVLHLFMRFFFFFLLLIL